MTNKLVTSANLNIGFLLEKVEALEKILKRGDSAMSTVKTTSSLQTMKEGGKGTDSAWEGHTSC